MRVSASNHLPQAHFSFWLTESRSCVPIGTRQLGTRPDHASLNMSSPMRQRKDCNSQSLTELSRDVKNTLIVFRDLCGQWSVILGPVCPQISDSRTLMRLQRGRRLVLSAYSVLFLVRH